MTTVHSAIFSGAFQPPPHRLTDEELDRISLTVPILIKRYDTNARCIYISPGSERFTAKPPSWFIGRSLDDYHNYPSEFLSAIRHSFRRILETREPQIFETSLEKPSGIRRRIHHHCPEFDENGTLVSIVSFTIDITDKHNFQLQLERTVEEQSSFHAMLAHELRNPLVAVLSGLQALDRAPSSEVAQRVREVMHKEITHITRLIEDLLDTARVETGALTYKKRSCQVEECINFAVAIVQPVIKNAEQRLNVSNHAPSAFLWADPNRIAQVISNLLHNASKFSQRGNAIAVCARVLNGEALIEISDQGRGIAVEEQDSIFERFSKGHRDTESSSSGLGLGLFVSREIIRSHSGTLELASSSPLGTTFRISLPIIGNDQDGNDEPQPPSLSRQQATILLVDDNTSGLETTKLLLELEGHTVYAATSAQDGLLLFDQYSPTIAILDLGLPDINGRLLAGQLRDRCKGRPLLLIALTGRGSEIDAKLSLEAGFDAHLIKPAPIDDLSALISQSLSPSE